MDGIETAVQGQFWGRSSTAEVVETVTLTLPPQGWQQLPVPIQAGCLRVNFRVASGGGPLGTYCYGVTVNDASNDGTVTTARPGTGAGLSLARRPLGASHRAASQFKMESVPCLVRKAQLSKTTWLDEGAPHE